MDTPSDLSAPHTISIPGGPTLETEWDERKRRHMVSCDLCGKKITLTKHGHNHSLFEHRGSTTCDDLQQKALRKRERAAAAATRAALFSTQHTGVTQAQPSPSSLDDPALGMPRSPSMHPVEPVTPTMPSLPLYTVPPTPQPSRSGSRVVSVEPIVFRLFSRDPGSVSPEIAGELTTSFADLRASSPSPGAASTEAGTSTLIPIESALGTGRSESADLEQRRPAAAEGGGCRGVLVEWKAGSVWDTYPYHQHAYRKYPWEPIGIENGNWFRLRATSCARSAVSAANDSPNICCSACQNIPTSDRYRKFLSRASSASDHTPWEYLNHRQLVAVCRTVVSENRKLRLKVMYSIAYS